jgi:hypothetical protein
MNADQKTSETQREYRWRWGSSERRPSSLRFRILFEKRLFHTQIGVPRAVLLTYSDDLSNVIRIVHGNAGHRGRNLPKGWAICVLDDVLQFGHDTVELFDRGSPIARDRT